MARFLTTVGSSSSIEDIIRTANKNITLVTPFIQLSNSVVERLLEASSNNILITLITRVDELKPWQIKKLDEILTVEVYDCYDLHAKCYCNETKAAITLMNLYEFSQNHRREMGIEVDKEADPHLFEDVKKEIASIKRISELVKSAVISDKSALESNSTLFSLGKKITFPAGQSVVASESAGNSDCHLPTLKDVFKKVYGGFEPILDKKLRVDNFPVRGVMLSIDFYLFFYLPSNDFKEKLRDRFEDTIKSEMPEITCYWNRSNVNVSPIGSDIQGCDEKSILLKTEGYLKTINYMSNLITQLSN